jgi:di/tripeptidase
LFVCDILAQAKHLQFSILDFQSKGGKGMDGVLRILFENEQDTQAFVNIAQKIILSKTKYGADITSIHIQRLSNQTIVIDQSIPKMLRYVMNATSKFRLPRDSQNLQGFVNLVKITKEKNKNVLFVQVTDFDYQQMLRQVMMLVEMGLADQMSVDIRAIYNNIEKHIQKHKYLINIPTQSALGLGFKPNLVPMRYSNGADLFLKQGLMIGNLGTGYFGAESPKEITSVQMLIRHSLWLFDICQRFYQF